jgi:Na+/H+-dicarboxylate symporter
MIMKNRMLFQVLAAIILAITAGALTPADATFFGIPLLSMYALLGQLFLNALSLVIVPLVSASMITGAARMGSEPSSLGSLGLKTLAAFLVSTSSAILIGLLLSTVLQPGLASQTLLQLPLPEAASTMDPIQGEGFQRIALLFLKMVPSNIIAAASQGQMLGLILFCLLFGYFSAKLEPQLATPLLNFWKGIFQVMMRITQLIMKVLPIGVFGLVAKAVASAGWETAASVGYLFLTVLAGLAVHMFLVMPWFLGTFGKIKPFAYFQAMLPALATAFSTSSSAATLPVTLDCVEKKAGISNRVSSFVLPLGASINLSGSALYVCAGVLFIAQIYGLQLPFHTSALVALMTLLTSLGTAGIPSASMFSIVVILQTIGLPADAIGLIMAIERILDMFRTVANVYGTACCAAIIAASEGEQLPLSSRKPQALENA